MVFPVVTAAAAAVLGLIFAALSAWVMAGRLSMGVLPGDGGKEVLNRRTRAHTNFIEYLPLILLLAPLPEGGGISRTLIEVLLVVLVVARLMHPFGMLAPPNSAQQYMFRGGAASATLAVLAVAAVALLVHCIAG
jgi:uncharacterized membrane protein YecN with MAPEG domain